MYASDWGQWLPGAAPTAPPFIPGNPAPVIPGLPDLQQLSSQLPVNIPAPQQAQINAALDLLKMINLR